MTCCDLHGTTQWEFKDTRVLKGPVGISVDNDGSVYVVCYSSNNGVVISSHGQRHRQLKVTTPLSFEIGIFHSGQPVCDDDHIILYWRF